MQQQRSIRTMQKGAADVKFESGSGEEEKLVTSIAVAKKTPVGQMDHGHKKCH